MAALGIKDVFTVSGGAAMHLLDSLGTNKDMNYISTHHEQAAAMAAETAAAAAVLAAAATVVLGSGTGLPLSTTHTLVGAVLGVGLARGISSIDLGVVGRIIVSWVVTLPVGAGLSILFFFTLKGIFS